MSLVFHPNEWKSCHSEGSSKIRGRVLLLAFTVHSTFYSHDLNTWGAGRIQESYGNLRRSQGFEAKLARISQPPECLDEAM